MTNYDKLTLEIETDGTVSPEDALSRAAEILVAQFGQFTSAGRKFTADEEVAGAADALPPNVLDMPIEDLDLPMRAYNSLKRNNIVKVGQLLQLQDEDLLRMRNFGRKSLDEMKDRLRMRGFLPPEDSDAIDDLDLRGRARGRADEDEDECLAMAHRIDGRKLGRKTGPRKALYASLIVAVLRYERIKTTEARAKEVRGMVEHMITLAKEGSLASRRRIIVAAAERAARHRQAHERDRPPLRRSKLGLHPGRQARPAGRRCRPDRPARARLAHPPGATRGVERRRPSRRSPERAAPCGTAHGSNTTARSSPASRRSLADGPSRASSNACWLTSTVAGRCGSPGRAGRTPGCMPRAR